MTYSEKCAMYHLPEITGTSEKQIAYAHARRESMLKAYEGGLNFAKAQEMLDTLTPEKIAEAVAKSGKSIDELIYNGLARRGLAHECVMLRVSDASTLIDYINKQ